MNELGYAIGQQALGVISRNQDSTFSALDREWDQLGAVFGGEGYMEATAFFTSCLPLDEAGTLLEMGCGSGVTSVVAALRGLTVTALDINPAAAVNTMMNARRHGVEGRVRALESDLFSALDPTEVFDIVYWNSNFIEAPADRSPESFFERAIFDPGYAAHRRFFRDARTRITEKGTIFLGFSEAAGNTELIHRLADEAGLSGRVYQQQTFAVPPSEMGLGPEFASHTDESGLVPADFTLLEFRPR